MDAEQAIADLMEVSSQVEAAVLLGADGELLASSLPPEPASGLADAARRLAEAGAARGEVTQLEAATRDGSVFVVRGGGRTIAAATGRTSTAGLVVYDLRTCLRGLAQADETPPAKPRRRRKQATSDAAA